MYQRILMPYDGSTSAQQALLEAVRLAKDQHAKLRIIHISEELSWPISSSTAAPNNIGVIEETLAQAGRAIVAEAARQAQAAGVDAETQLIETLTEPPMQAILDDVRQWHPDLIVMGTHGRHGLERMFIGSVADGVVRAANVPVMLVHHPQPKAAGT